MSQGLATIVQLAILIFFVLSGVTFQLIRELPRGPLPAHKDMGERILRAVVASIVLDTFHTQYPAVDRMGRTRRRAETMMDRRADLER